LVPVIVELVMLAPAGPVVPSAPTPKLVLP
jgi:hypothetical protein